MARTRGNGEGSVYQRSDGKWCAAVTLDGGSVRRSTECARQDVIEEAHHLGLKDHHRKLAGRDGAAKMLSDFSTVGLTIR